MKMPSPHTSKAGWLFPGGQVQALAALCQSLLTTKCSHTPRGNLCPHDKYCPSSAPRQAASPHLPSFLMWQT